MKPRLQADEPSPPTIDDRPTVLVADGDRISERAVELALAQCDYRVEWARDGESALDIMRRAKVDAVVADSILSDMSGVTLMRRTFELCGPGAPAFVFVSVDRAVATRVNLLTSGATDYLVKPFAAEELRVRVTNTIETRRGAHANATRGMTGLAGDCSQVPIADLLTMLEFSRKSGTIAVSVGPAVGRLVLDCGRVVHAEVGTVSGSDAFFVLLRYNSGLFRFEPGERDSPHTLNARVSELLLDAAVRDDTDKHFIDEDARRRTEAGLRELGVVKTPIKLRSRAEPTPRPPSLVSGIQRMVVLLSDPLLLGDLSLSPAVPAGALPQFRVELWASIIDGVNAMVGLSSPPGHRVLMSALAGERGRLHLQFEFETATLIVTLVDVEGHDELPGEKPDAVIVAPPSGELVMLAPERLAELTGRVSNDDDLAIVAVGGPALQATIGPLVTADAGGGRFLGIGAVDSDLRDTLCSVLRLWAKNR